MSADRPPGVPGGQNGSMPAPTLRWIAPTQHAPCPALSVTLPANAFSTFLIPASQD